MKIDQGTDNGNVAAINRYEHLPHVHHNNRSWLLSNSRSDNQYQTDNLQYNLNSNFNHHETQSHGVFDLTSKSPDKEDGDSQCVKEVCNRQYRIYSQNNINVNTSNILQSSNLAGSVVSAIVNREIFKGVFLTNSLTSSLFTNYMPLNVATILPCLK